MNWILIFLPVVLDFIRKQQAGNPKLSKSKVKKALFLAIDSGTLRLPAGITPELAKLVIPLLLDVIWGLMDNTRDIQKVYLQRIKR